MSKQRDIGLSSWWFSVQLSTIYILNIYLLCRFIVNLCGFESIDLKKYTSYACEKDLNDIPN